MSEKPSRKIIILFGLAALGFLALYAGWFGAIRAGNSEYLNNFRNAPNPDAVTYVQLGRNLCLHGEYSRNPNQPYHPDFKWTPVFPCIAGMLDLAGGVTAILVGNIILTLSGALLLARLGFLLTQSRRISVLLFVFLALDPLVWSVNLQAMADASFLFFLILGAYWTFPALFSEESVSRKHLLFLLLGGLAFGFGTLTRPSGLYVPWIFLLAIFITFFWKWIQTLRHDESTVHIGFNHHNSAIFWLNRQLLPIFLFLFAAFLPVSLWMLRNFEVFGKLSLCSNQNIVMVYYTGGGAWQMELNCSLEEAQKRIQSEFHIHSNTECQNPEAFGLDQARLDDELEACKGKVLFRYPKSLVISSCTGVVKSLLAHETRTLLAISRGADAPSETESVVSSWIFLWSIAFQGLLLGLGAWAILRNPLRIARFFREKPALALTLTGISAYFLLTMMLSGMDCCARYRLPLMPILYFVASWQLTKAPRIG